MKHVQLGYRRQQFNTQYKIDLSKSNLYVNQWAPQKMLYASLQITCHRHYIYIVSSIKVVLIIVYTRTNFFERSRLILVPVYDWCKQCPSITEDNHDEKIGCIFKKNATTRVDGNIPGRCRPCWMWQKWTTGQSTQILYPFDIWTRQ